LDEEILRNTAISVSKAVVNSKLKKIADSLGMSEKTIAASAHRTILG